MSPAAFPLSDQERTERSPFDCLCHVGNSKPKPCLHFQFADQNLTTTFSPFQDLKLDPAWTACYYRNGLHTNLSLLSRLSTCTTPILPSTPLCENKQRRPTHSANVTAGGASTISSLLLTQKIKLQRRIAYAIPIDALLMKLLLLNEEVRRCAHDVFS